jgi:class 3 adenylate cyclase
MVKRYSFVSCDIVGHSAERNLANQLMRVDAINALVRKVMQRAEPGSVVWASGGDGGHVAIRVGQPKNLALELIADLRKWSVEAGLRLRISAHVGDVDEIKGADGRTQLVGHGINLAGRLVEYGGQNRVVVSASFRDLYRSSESRGVRFHSAKTVIPKYFAINTIYLLSMNGQFESSWQGTIETRRAAIAQPLPEVDNEPVVIRV